ncbi:hypothetical protein O9992_07985 [Vibrio lentus]|nr:hypothetical protein [Vibrio lentus]
MRCKVTRMPSGGFCNELTDITVFRQAEQALKDANESLSREFMSGLKSSKLNQRLVKATKFRIKNLNLRVVF